MTTGWAGKGSTTAWRRTRTAVLVRDRHQCQLQLSGCTGHATHVHHTLGKQHGDNPSHLIAACEHCNLTLGDPTATNPDPMPAVPWTEWPDE